MEIDLESVDMDDRLRVMQHPTNDEFHDLYKTQLTIEEKALYLRAQDYPESITPADKNEILERMNPDEEDRLCRERTGIPFKELQAKAMEDADSLTEVEAAILVYGGDCDIDAPKKFLQRRFSLMDLVDPEEKKLVHQVWSLLGDDFETAVAKKARSRLKDIYEQENPQQKAARRVLKRQRLHCAKLAKWVQDILDAKPPRCGFVIFRTVYGDGSDEKWKLFGSHERLARNVHLKHHWKRATNLTSKFHSVYVSDPSIQGLDAKDLRDRFISMRGRGEIPEGIATSCFLVADEAVLNNAVIEGNILFSAKSADHPDPWYDTLPIRAISPDYDGPDGGREIVLPIPKTFEWLYFYTTFTTDTPWEKLVEMAQAGPAEILEPFAPLPLWRYKGKEVRRISTLRHIC